MLSGHVIADHERLIHAIAEHKLDELGFTNTIVSGPVRDAPTDVYMTIGLYFDEPNYRVIGLDARAAKLSGETVREEILSYQIREDFMRRHRAIVSEFIPLDLSPDSEATNILWSLTIGWSWVSGLPLAFFTRSKYLSDQADATTLWFPKHLMPDQVLVQFKEFIRRKREEKHQGRG